MTYPTSANFKTWAGISGSGDDTVVGYALDGAKAWFERECNRVFVAASATKKFPVRHPYVGKDKTRLNLLGQFLVAVTSITNGDDDVLVVDTEYVLHPLAAPYHRVDIVRASGLFWTDGGDGSPVTIEATWGESAACPADVFLGILELAQAEYLARMQGTGGTVQFSGNSGMILQPSEFPKRVHEIADNYRLRGV